MNNPRETITLLLAAVVLVLGSTHVRAQTDPLEEARQVYQSGDFDRSIELFTALLADPASPKAVQKEALQYLGRAYVARNEFEEAKRAVADLLELEPPLVELDPDLESPPLMNIYYDVRKELEGYEVQRADPGMKTLAVMDFTNSSVDDHERLDPLQKGFASMMINYLSGTTQLKVIERERVQWLLGELELQRNPSLIDQASAVRTGKLLGASAVIFGAYTMHGREMWISARMVDVETGEILLSEQIFGRSDRFFEAIQTLSTQVARAINVALQATELGVRTETQSLDAMLSYSEGLKLLEQNDYRGAYEKFNEALAYDPGYTRAQLKAESISPLLAAR